MNSNTFELGQGAMRMMEEAILSALADGSCLGPKEISDMTGIFRGERPNGTVQRNDVIVSEMLFNLLDHGRVRRCIQRNGRNGWQLIAN